MPNDNPGQYMANDVTVLSTVSPNRPVFACRYEGASQGLFLFSVGHWRYFFENENFAFDYFIMFYRHVFDPFQ